MYIVSKTGLNRVVVGVCILTSLFVFAALGQQLPAGDQFYQAIRTNDLAVLRTLVGEYGVNATDSSGMTPLMLAAAFGTRDAVSALIGAGADVKARNGAGVTALHAKIYEKCRARHRARATGKTT